MSAEKRLVGMQPKLRYQFVQESARFVEELDVLGGNTCIRATKNKSPIFWSLFRIMVINSNAQNITFQQSN